MDSQDPWKISKVVKLAVFATNEPEQAVQVLGLQLHELLLQRPGQQLLSPLSNMYCILLGGTTEEV